MRTALRLVLGLTALVVVVIVIAVNALSVPRSELPPVDPSTVVHLMDGTEITLAALLAGDPAPADRGANPVTPPPVADAAGDVGATVDGGTDGERPSPQRRAGTERRIRGRLLPRTNSRDPYELADFHMRRGHTDEALVLYRSVPESHPQWGRAQRRIGWHLFADQKDEPARGVPFVHAAIRDDPLDGNAWQDAARVYLATVGLPAD